MEQNELLSVIDRLPPRERNLVVAHFGLDAAQAPLSLARWARRWGLPRRGCVRLKPGLCAELRRLIEEHRAMPVALSSR